MFELKYREKSKLIDYELSLHLFERFNLKIKDIVPVRDVFVLRSDKGDKILKKIDYSLEELSFIHTAIKYIKKSFSRVIDFQKTNEDFIYVKWNNDFYCLMDLIEGRECEFNNPVDIGIASRGLGELHKASEGFRYDLPSKNTYGKVIDAFNRRLEEVKFFKNIVNMYENKTDFDKIFIENVDYYLGEIQKSINLISGTQYFKLCSEEDKIVLCHHDLAHHNILINNGEAYFVDFDYSVIDLKVHDLCNFINKAIKNFAYDHEKCELIINEYCTNNSLDIRELQVLHGLLTFPQDFYEIARDYYTRRKKWEEEVFLYKLRRKVGFKEDNKEFIEEFKNTFL